MHIKYDSNMRMEIEVPIAALRWQSNTPVIGAVIVTGSVYATKAAK